jgi:hypothetical protein
MPILLLIEFTGYVVEMEQWLSTSATINLNGKEPGSNIIIEPRK